MWNHERSIRFHLDSYNLLQTITLPRILKNLINILLHPGELQNYMFFKNIIVAATKVWKSTPSGHARSIECLVVPVGNRTMGPGYHFQEDTGLVRRFSHRRASLLYGDTAFRASVLTDDYHAFYAPISLPLFYHGSKERHKHSTAAPHSPLTWFLRWSSRIAEFSQIEARLERVYF